MKIPDYCIIDVRNLSDEEKTNFFEEKIKSKYNYENISFPRIIENINYIRIDKDNPRNILVNCYVTNKGRKEIDEETRNSFGGTFSNNFDRNYEIIDAEKILSKKPNLINLI